MLKISKISTIIMLSVALSLFSVAVSTTSAVAQPDPLECMFVSHEGREVPDLEGILWICKCADPGIKGWSPICAWVKKDDTVRNTKNSLFISQSTNSVAVIDIGIERHIGGPGNFAQTDVSLFGSSGNRISRPIGARTIDSWWNGSTWVTCHDSNWQYASGSAQHFARREPVNCGPHTYRARGAGTYFSYSLNRWLTSGFLTTVSLCVPATACGVSPTKRE